MGKNEVLRYSISEIREMLNANFKVHIKGIGFNLVGFNGFVGHAGLVKYMPNVEIQCLIERALKSKKDKFQCTYRGYFSVTLYSK